MNLYNLKSQAIKRSANVDGLESYQHVLGWCWSDRTAWVWAWVPSPQIFNRESFKIWSQEVYFFNSPSNRLQSTFEHTQSPDDAHEPLHRPISAFRSNAISIHDQNGTTASTFTEKRGLILIVLQMNVQFFCLQNFDP